MPPPRTRTESLNVRAIENMRGFSGCGKSPLVVIPRRAFRRGISLLLDLDRREIPSFARNDSTNDFFRSHFSRKRPPLDYRSLMN